MMDETYLLEHIKEQLCFVSQDTAADLRAARGRASPFRCARGDWAWRGRCGSGALVRRIGLT